MVFTYVCMYWHEVPLTLISLGVRMPELNPTEYILFLFLFLLARYRHAEDTSLTIIENQWI